MAQTNLWQNFNKKIRIAGGYAERVENGLGSGMPDVVYTLHDATGFVELKFLARAPVRESSLLRLGPNKHILTQLNWAHRWMRRGGIVHWLVQVHNEYMLFDPRNLPRDGTPLTLAETRLKMRWCSVGELAFDRLAPFL